MTFTTTYRRQQSVTTLEILVSLVVGMVLSDDVTCALVFPVASAENEYAVTVTDW